MNCQDHLYRNLHPRQITRRWFFEQCGVGLGAAALGQLMAESGYAASDPLAPKAPHFAPKAKHVIFLFMAGAPSHLELFDNKPQLAKLDGQPIPESFTRGQPIAQLQGSGRHHGGNPLRRVVDINRRERLAPRRTRARRQFGGHRSMVPWQPHGYISSPG